MSVQVFTALVKDGAIVPDEGVALPEGARVTVIAGELTAPVDLTPEQERELDEAIAGVARGEVVSAAELFRRLSR